MKSSLQLMHVILL